MLYRIAFLGIVSLVAQVSAALGADCNYLPERARPIWAGGAQQTDKQALETSGQAPVERNLFSSALAQARQDALTNLAGAIQVNISSTTTVAQSKSNAGKRWLTDTNVQSLSSATSNLLLRDVQFDEPWLDRKSCMVWMHAKLSRALVEEILREQLTRTAIAELKLQLARIDSTELLLPARQDALDFADSIMRDLDFSALKGESPGAAYFQTALQTRRRQLADELKNVAILQSALSEIDVTLSTAQSASTTDAKLAAYRRALRKLEATRQQLPDGVRGVASSVDLSLRGADIELLRNSSCGALRFWSRIESGVQSALPLTTRQRFGMLVCQPADVRHEAWRAAFEGRAINVICLQELMEQRDQWTKACETITGDLRAIGAQVQLLRAVDFAKPLAAWANGGELKVAQVGSSQVLILAANGRITTRKGSEGASDPEYQFSGNLMSVYVDKGQVAASDPFTATTGWNPVSPQMTMELLALNVYRRFKDKLESYFSAQTSEHP